MATSPAPRPLTARDLWLLARVGDPVVARDGRFAIAPVKRWDLGAEPGAAKGIERLVQFFPDGRARPLTSAEVSASAPALSHDGNRLAFLRADAGKQSQLHVLELAGGGEARKVTDLPMGALEMRWLPDGAHMIVLAHVLGEDLTLEGTRALVAKRDKAGTVPHVTEDRIYRYWDRWLTGGEVPHLFVLDVATGALRDLTPDARRWFELMDPGGQFDISPDGSEVVFSADVSTPPHARVRFALFTVPVAGGATTCITPDHAADAVRPRYSPDGAAIVYGMQQDPDHYADRVRLARFERATGSHSVLTEGWDRSCDGWEFADAATLVVTAEEHARGALFVTDPRTPGTPQRLLASGSVHGAAVGGGQVWFQHHSLSSPPELARVAVTMVGGPHAAPTPVSRENAALMAEIALGEVEEVHFPGAGGAEVQMFVMHPPGRRAEQKLPLVHLIHGGPHGVFGDQWHFRWNAQVLAGAGYRVAMVNFHGSSSFGQAFTDAILGDWGGKAAQDILLATDLLVARGLADPARMAITGGSFGGYMSCWLATQTDRFRCAIAHAAVYNLSSKHNTDVTQGLGRAMGGEPWTAEGAENIRRWNPAAHTAGYRTPMLIIHGEKDYRVPVTHGLEVYGILKAKGIDARLVYYPDENHWILKPANSLHWYGEFLGWLKRYLG